MISEMDVKMTDGDDRGVLLLDGESRERFVGGDLDLYDFNLRSFPLLFLGHNPALRCTVVRSGLVSLFQCRVPRTLSENATERLNHHVTADSHIILLFTKHLLICGLSVFLYTIRILFKSLYVF